MKKLVTQLQSFSLSRSILYIIFGLIIIIAPLSIRNLIFYLISAYLAYFACLNFYLAFKNRQLTGGILGIRFVLGGILLLLAVININFISAISRFIPIILGIILILNALFKLSYSGPIKEVNPQYRLSSILYSAMIAIAGLTLIFNPFGTETTLLRIFGTALLVIGLVDLWRNNQR